MVAERTTDGRRLAELLSSELTGRQVPPFDRVTVENADTDADPSPEGTHAYDIALGGCRDASHGAALDGDVVASVAMQPERVRVDLSVGVDAAVEAAGDAGLRVRPVAAEPPRVLVFVTDAAAVKRVVDVLAAALGE